MKRPDIFRRISHSRTLPVNEADSFWTDDNVPGPHVGMEESPVREFGGDHRFWPAFNQHLGKGVTFGMREELIPLSEETLRVGRQLSELFSVRHRVLVEFAQKMSDRFYIILPVPSRPIFVDQNGVLPRKVGDRIRRNFGALETGQ